MLNSLLTKRIICIFLVGIILLFTFNLYAQRSENCFLNDFELKTAEIPQSINAEKTSEAPSVVVTINADTLGKISKYVF